MVSDFQALLSDFWGNFHVLFHYYLANGCCMPNRLAFTQHKEELQTPRRLRQSLTYRQSCPFLQGLPKQLYFFFPFNFFLVWILNIVISESSDVLKNFPLFYKLLDLWVFPVLCYFEILVLSPFSYPFLWFLSANYSFSRFYIFVFSCSFSAFFSNSRNFTRFRVIQHFSVILHVFV